jgi:hypothetical protein
MNIDKLTELLNKRVDYQEVIKKLDDKDFRIAIYLPGAYGYCSKILDDDCKNIVINYYINKIKDIENKVKDL